MKPQISKRAKVISEYVDAMYPNVSNATKEDIAKRMHLDLSDSAIDELEKSLADE